MKAFQIAGAEIDSMIRRIEELDSSEFALLFLRLNQLADEAEKTSQQVREAGIAIRGIEIAEGNGQWIH